MKTSNRWIWTLIQGIIALGFGVWLLLGRSSAMTAVEYAAAIYLAVAGIIQTARALLSWGRPNAVPELTRGLIGLIGGALVLVLAYFTSTAQATTILLLALTLIAVGAVGVFNTMFARGGQPFEWQPVLVNLLLILLGALILIDRTQPIDIVLWASLIFIAAGAAIILYAFTRQRGAKVATTAV
jgi:uncharacterized membrane protein HdeD (DUF308 family)